MNFRGVSLYDERSFEYHTARRSYYTRKSGSGQGKEALSIYSGFHPNQLIRIKMKYGDLTYLEIREAVESGCLAIIPTGCTEQQGPHLPVDFDTWFAEKVCLAGSGKALEEFGLRSLVLPALPFGPTPEHRNFGSGYIDLPQSLHEEVIYEVLSSMADQGFTSIVVWRGCGQHDLSQAIRRFNTKYEDRSKAVQPNMPYSRIWNRLGFEQLPGGHADSFATSVAFYLRPESVRRARIKNPNNRPVDWGDPHLDLSDYSSTGVIGDPTQGSKEIGEKLWEALVEEAAEIFRESFSPNAK